MKYVAHTYVGKRANNEDCCAAVRMRPLTAALDGALDVLVLSDGMGGLEHGERVSAEVVRTVTTELFKACAAPALLQDSNEPALDIAAQASVWLADTLRVTNQRTRRMIEQNGWSQAGATVVACLIHDAVCWYAHLGDSRLYHWDAAAQTLTQRTSDHTVAQMLVEQQLISTEMARHHAQKNNLVLYAGTESLPDDLPVGYTTLAPGDRLLLCSDGISGEPEPETLSACFHDRDLAATATALLQAAMDAGSMDNMTILLYAYDAEPTAERIRLDVQALEDAYQTSGGAPDASLEEQELPAHSQSTPLDAPPAPDDPDATIRRGPLTE